ncbi:MAG: error-prone DNA polymerase [Proteobacteria bacterium]|nr:error-prone DNA polymerase [Pseudomonadota bacterium]
MPDYAELQVCTNFSFLRGASHPHELVHTAKALGLRAIGICDHNSLAGVVRAHVAAKEEGMELRVGARVNLEDAPSFLVYPRDRNAYGRLSRLLTLGQRRAEKGKCQLFLKDLQAHREGQILIALAAPDPVVFKFEENLKKVIQTIDNDIYLAISHYYSGNDRKRIATLAALAGRLGLRTVVTNDVHAHSPDRKPLQDVVSCIREGCTLETAGLKLLANGERHLKSGAEMARLFKGYEAALARTVEIAEAIQFSLDELRYNYPHEPVPEGRTADGYLRQLTEQGLEHRFPDGVPAKVREIAQHELRLIGQLSYAPYFLTVYDIVRFARSRGILCQGRGSAANSVICYALGITAVDPTEIDLLFERFISAERNEPPDIDVDFEHERREEVIQYIYARYGRHRAALAATVVTYRYRSAVREVGKVLGLSEDATGALAGAVWGWSGEGFGEREVREAGFDPTDPNVQLVLKLTEELIRFPRHLSQHVGGFVLTETPLSEVVPIGNAAMADRTVVEWDKDDLDALGILKIDVLALGMLTCIRKCFDLVDAHYGKRFSLASVPRQDTATYDMLCKADSVGVFQVESRAQMNMLPRLKPRSYYDLVIEVAIVRPGPIQGDMVHPYLRRRCGDEAVHYPAPDPAFGPPDELRRVLHKTLGVPLFQEQAMRIAIVAAGFTPAEADQLRRAMATFRHRGIINRFRDRLVSGMTRRGYDQEFASRCFKQIEGFGEYGFPESHAASFALLVYVSAWLKCHYPAVFACGLLNSQPMGFYAPAQIVRDAREHGVEVHPPDVNLSDWDSRLEAAADSWSLRLGLRQVGGLRQDEADKIVMARQSAMAGQQEYRSIAELHRRSGAGRASIERLANADAYRSMGLDRRQALWQVRALPDQAALPLFAASEVEEQEPGPEVTLPRMPLREHVVNDYQTLRLSLKAHPVSFFREDFRARRLLTAIEVATAKDGRRIQTAGLVLVRQRPGTAKGVVFMTIEDETGIVNVIVWPKVMERFRKVVMTSRLLRVRGKVQRTEDILHLVAEELEDLSPLLLSLSDAT